MKHVYILVFIVFSTIPVFSYCQAPCTGFISTASQYDDYFFSYDTLCVGSCQKYWVTNAACPEFAQVGFHWVFYGNTGNDTLVGDTVYYCFNDTGTFRMDLYGSEFNLDSAHNLNGANVILACPPNANFTGIPQTVCANQVVKFTDKSSINVTTWHWTFEGGQPASFTGKQPPPIVYPDTGTFYVRLAVSSPYGVSDTIKTAYVHVTPGPSPVAVTHSFNISEGDSVKLEACATGSGYTWSYSPGILSNHDTTLTVQPEKTQTYLLTVTENECEVACAYVVYVKSGLLVPTAFSPNNDGVNDAFRILNTNIKLLNLSIYNRWGELVFSTNDLTEGWNGIYKGIEQPMGTYIWACDYQITGTGKSKSTRGNVTLLR